MSLALLFKLLVYLYVLVVVTRVYASHPWKRHKKAIKKFIAIWLISTLPIIIAALMDRPPDETNSVSGGFLSKIYSFFPIQEQFVYAAAFIAPVLYIFVEATIDAITGENTHFRDELKRHIRGYGSILMPSFLLFILTCISFAGFKQGGEEFQKTYLYLLFGSQALFIYLATLALWYASILLESVAAPFLPQQRAQEEANFSDDARARLG